MTDHKKLINVNASLDGNGFLSQKKRYTKNSIKMSVKMP